MAGRGARTDDREVFSRSQRRRWWRYRLPDVPPRVARRRRIFFAVVAAVAVVAAASTTAALAAVVDARATGARPAAHTIAATEPTGCTLLVAGHLVRLSDQLAMTLTDIAGRDQNAAASLLHTATAVANTWPAEASVSGAVARSLRGYVPRALGCTATLPPATRQAMGPNGLTPRANTMWDAIKSIFGPLPAGGFAPGGVTTGHMPGSAHYEGRAIDFLYRPVSPKSIRHGWVLAQWAEAHAASLQIATVIFDDRVWTPSTWDSRGWQPYTVPEGPTSNRTLLHVQRGSPTAP